MVPTLRVDTGVKVKAVGGRCVGGHMLIGELAARTGVSARSLRYYEQQGLLCPERTPGGYRTFAADDVRTVRQIRALLRAGFPSSVVALLLPCADGDDARVELCPQVAAEMRRTLHAIEDELRTLTGRREAVRALLAPR